MSDEAHHRRRRVAVGARHRGGGARDLRRHAGVHDDETCFVFVCIFALPPASPPSDGDRHILTSACRRAVRARRRCPRGVESLATAEVRASDTGIDERMSTCAVPLVDGRLSIGGCGREDADVHWRQRPRNSNGGRHSECMTSMMAKRAVKRTRDKPGRRTATRRCARNSSRRQGVHDVHTCSVFVLCL